MESDQLQIETLESLELQLVTARQYGWSQNLLHHEIACTPFAICNTVVIPSV